MDGGRDQPYFIYPVLGGTKDGPGTSIRSPSLPASRHSRSEDADGPTAYGASYVLLAKPNPLSPAVGCHPRASQISPHVRTPPRLREFVFRKLHVRRLAVVMLPAYPCFSTVVSSTTRSTISPAMSSAALRSSSFFWATSTRAACQADQ